MGDPDTGYALLTISVLMLPTIICQLIPIIYGRNTTPFMTYLFSLLRNVSLGLLLFSGSDSGTFLPGFLLTCYPIILMMFPIYKCGDCCCDNCSQECHFACRRICEDKQEAGAFFREVCDNRARPPRVMCYVEASHIHIQEIRHTEYDSDGNVRRWTERRRTKVVTYENQMEYKYGSWGEGGYSVTLGSNGLINAFCTVRVQLNESAERDVQKIRDILYQQGRRVEEEDVVTWSTRTTPGFVSEIYGCIAKDEPCVVRHYQSCGGRFLWFVLFVLGYSSAYEAIWCSQTDRMKIRMVKGISGVPKEFRCAYGEWDVAAAERTFIEEIKVLEPDSSNVEQVSPPTVNDSSNL